MTDRRTLVQMCLVALGVAVIVSLSACSACNPDPSGAIDGTVYYMQWQPLIYATVRTVPPTTSVMTDLTASFSIPNVRPGLYEVIAEYGVANSGRAHVTVHPNKTTTVVIIVRPDALQD